MLCSRLCIKFALFACFQTLNVFWLGRSSVGRHGGAPVLHRLPPGALPPTVPKNIRMRQNWEVPNGRRCDYECKNGCLSFCVATWPRLRPTTVGIDSVTQTPTYPPFLSPPHVTLSGGEAVLGNGWKDVGFKHWGRHFSRQVRWHMIEMAVVPGKHKNFKLHTLTTSSQVK